ncbi:MAG: AAA family ATPase [Nanoarchaeota archaeon]|nr:AAA family ATPase [Nanoarchaeota archaeon]
MADLFKGFLSDSESIFKNEIALDPEFSPKLIPFRESENQYIATCIKPLFQNRTGKNLIIHGSPGVGKTLACKNVIKELEETTDDILPVYANCWKKNSTYQIVLAICEALNYKFTHNKRTDELIAIVTQKLNRKSSVIILDEIDKIENLDILYHLAENLYRKTIILITNDSNWTYKLDPRLKSRLVPDRLEFRPYTLEETREILKQRIHHAFNSETLTSSEEIAKKTFELKDIRIGLFLLREAAEIAESFSTKKISEEHVNKAIEKLSNFQKPVALDDDEKAILDLIKSNPEKTTAGIYNIYKEKFGLKSERTFQRKIKSLEKSNIVKLTRIEDIHGRSYRIKQLTEF